MNRAPYQPPPPPDAPAVHAPRAARSPRTARERIQALLAFSGAVGFLSAWLWLWLAVIPPRSIYLYVCVALPGLVCGLIAVGVLALPLVEEGGAAWLDWHAGQQEVALRGAAGWAQIAALDAHVDHVYGPPPLRERVTYINSWDAPTKARVSNPHPATRPTDADTQRLPALPEPAPVVAYHDTPLELVVLALASGAPCSVRQRPGGIARPPFEAAVSRLIAAGVVRQERGKPPTLTPPFARLTTTPNYLQYQVIKALEASEP